MVKKSFPAFVMNGWNVTATGVKASTYVKNRNIVKNHINRHLAVIVYHNSMP